MELTNFDKEEWKDGNHQEFILEQYKMYVESTEKVSDRRNNLNTFYLSITTSITIVIGYVKTNKIDNDEFLIIGLTISGIIICIYWNKLLENYRRLNSAKFKVIHEIESYLPLNLYRYEWEKLGKGKDPKLYKRISKIEKVIPYVFGTIFLFVVVVEIVQQFC